MARKVLVRRLAFSTVAMVITCGLYSATRRICAETLARGSHRDLERALALVPENPAYWLRRADLLESEGQSPVEALEAAAALAPYDAAIWIRLGLDAEMRGDFRAAESSLLRAAQVSRLYEPRWTLANYYFRRSSPAEFWKWTHLALEVAPADPTALFRLAWSMSADPDEIFREAMPKDRRLWRDYARFVMSQKQVESARSTIERLLPDAGLEDRDLLLEACDRSIDEGSAGFALAIWNTLCDRKLLLSSAVHAGSEILLSESAPDPRGFGHGFAWRGGDLAGVEYAVRSGVMMLDFSGREPENAVLLRRWIPVTPGRKAVVRFEYQTSGIPNRSGLCLQVVGSDSRRPVASSNWLSSSTWQKEEVRFDVRPGNNAMLLELQYSRLPGEVRAEGSLYLRAMRLEFQP